MSPPGSNALVLKRSLTIAGHRTSISLEDAFWAGLQWIAEERNSSVAALVADIDRGRGDANLSSAVRVFVLERFRSGPSIRREAPSSDPTASGPLIPRGETGPDPLAG